MNYRTVPLKEPLKQFQIDNCLEWCAALRSGDYHQTDKVLMSLTMKSFCCLGVACDIKGMERMVDYDRLNAGFKYKEVMSDTLPPNDFFNFTYGFSAPTVIAYSETNGNLELASLNDEFGFTFIAIADVIEAIATSRTPVRFSYDRTSQINTRL